MDYILDLDALLGDAKPLIVRFEGREYTVRRLDALSPQEIVHLQRIFRHVSEYAGRLQAGEIEDEEAAGLLESLHSFLRLVAPDVPAEKLPLLAMLRLLAWYSEQVAPDLKKAPAAS